MNLKLKKNLHNSLIQILKQILNTNENSCNFNYKLLIAINNFKQVFKSIGSKNL